MFMLYALAIGFAGGLILGGRPGKLGAVRLRWVPVALVGLVVQVLLFSTPVSERIGNLGPYVYVGSTAAVLAVVVRNVRLPGFPIIAAGAGSNLLAIVANGGYMPADSAVVASLGYNAAQGYSNSRELADPVLRLLTDVYALPAWLPMTNIFSVGDVLVGIGVAITIVLLMEPRRLPRKAGARRQLPRPAASRGTTGSSPDRVFPY